MVLFRKFVDICIYKINSLMIHLFFRSSTLIKLVISQKTCENQYNHNSMILLAAVVLQSGLNDEKS